MTLMAVFTILKVPHNLHKFFENIGQTCRNFYNDIFLYIHLYSPNMVDTNTEKT